MQSKQHPYAIMQQAFQQTTVPNAPPLQQVLYDHYKCLPSDLLYVYCTAKYNTSSTSRQADALSQSLTILFNTLLEHGHVQKDVMLTHLTRIKSSLSQLPVLLRPLYDRVVALIENDLLLTFTLLAETINKKNDFCSLSAFTSKLEWAYLYSELKDGTIRLDFLQAIFSITCSRAILALRQEEIQVRAHSFVLKNSNPEGGDPMFASPFRPGIMVSTSMDSRLHSYNHQRSALLSSPHAPNSATKKWWEESYAFFNASHDSEEVPAASSTNTQYRYNS